MKLPLEDQDRQVGEALLQLQRERQPGQAAAGDDDVVALNVKQSLDLPLSRSLALRLAAP